MPPVRSKKHADENPETEERNAEFILERQARNQTKQYPQLLVAGFQNSDKDIKRQCPEENIETVHGVEIEYREIDRCDQNCGGGKNLSKSLTAKLARKQTCKKYDARIRERGKQTECGKRITK